MGAMRKALIVFLLLFALVLSGAVYAFSDVSTIRDEVEVTEIVRYGDSSAAEGLSLGLHTNYDNYLFWNVDYTPTRPEVTEADYRVSIKKDYGNYDYDYTGIYLRNFDDVPSEIELLSESDTGLARAYYELYMEIGPREHKEREIYLKDYMDYYPITGDMDLEGLNMGMYPEGHEWRADENNPEGFRALNEFFRIPVLEEETFHISLGKDENGRINSRGSGTGNADDFYSMYVDSAVLPDGVYFTINNRTNLKEEIIDTSLIPGGYGIYRLPYTLENGEYEVGFDSLSTVKSLDENFEVSFMLTDEAGETIILIGNINAQLRMLVIDASTMETLQDIEIVSTGNTGCWQYFDGGDFLALSIDDNRLALIERQESGEYLVRFVVEDIADGVYYNRYDVQDMAWNGEKLALSGYKGLDDINERFVADFYYAVYDETGLRCFTDCDSSLCINEDQQWGCVRGNDAGSMTLEWR